MKYGATRSLQLKGAHLQERGLFWAQKVRCIGILGVLWQRHSAQQQGVAAILEGRQHLGVAPEQDALRLQMSGKRCVTCALPMRATTHT